MKAIYRSYAPPFDTIIECLEGYSLDDYEEERCICMWFPEDADSTLNCNTERTFWYHASYGTSRATVARSEARFATVMRDIGHTEFITDEAGRPYQYFAYMPFGEQYVEQHAANGFYSSAFRFNDSREGSTASAEGSARSAEYDEYTGQYYYGARYHDPLIGIWLSPDPMFFARPNLTPYNFVQNNPIMLWDPTGMLDSGGEDETKVEGGITYVKIDGHWIPQSESVADGPGVYAGSSYDGPYDAEYYEEKAEATSPPGSMPLPEESGSQSEDQMSLSEQLILAWDLRVIGGNIPDLISMDINLGSTFGAGASMTYSFNIFTRGERGMNITRTEQERWGAEIDWSMNLNLSYFLGNPLSIKQSSVAGPLKSLSGGACGYGLQGYIGYDEKTGESMWIGTGTGIGFNWGASYGSGRTFILFP